MEHRETSELGSATQQDPGFISASQRSAFARVKERILAGRTSVLLTGDPGTGKTTVLERVLAAVPADLVSLVRIDARETPPAELKRAIGAALMALVSQAQAGSVQAGKGKVLVAVDDANDLRRDTLDALERLVSDPALTAAGLQLLFAARPNFTMRLAYNNMQGLSAYLATKVSLSPLSPEEARCYAERRIKAEGGGRERPVAPRRLARILAEARGNPRQIADGVAEALNGTAEAREPWREAFASRLASARAAIAERTRQTSSRPLGRAALFGVPLLVGGVVCWQALGSSGPRPSVPPTIDRTSRGAERDAPAQPRAFGRTTVPPARGAAPVSAPESPPFAKARPAPVITTAAGPDAGLLSVHPAPSAPPARLTAHAGADPARIASRPAAALAAATAAGPALPAQSPSLPPRAAAPAVATSLRRIARPSAVSPVRVPDGTPGSPAEPGAMAAAVPPLHAGAAGRAPAAAQAAEAVVLRTVILASRPTPSRRGSPGLLLVAQAGDTMPSMYRRVYQGLTPPPYKQVAALNPSALKPGSMVVFPPPPDGWGRR